jgi:SSS family solute:Na+ symporter
MTLSRFVVFVIMAFALVLAIFLHKELVLLLILGYDGVSQFFPGVVLGLFWKRVTRAGVFSGIGGGIILVSFLIISGRDPFLGMNAGFVALGLNALLTVSVSLMTKPEKGGFE